MFSFFVLISTFAFGLAIAAVLNWLFKHLSKRRTVGLPALLLEHSRSPLWVLIPSLLVLVTVKHTLISPQVQDTIRHSFNIAMIGGLGWLLIEELFAVRDFILGKFDIRASDNLKARAVHTQVRILTRILSVIIMLFAFSSILGWSYYGQQALRFLSGSDKLLFLYKGAFLLCIPLGSVLDSGSLWAMVDLWDGLMALPNLIGLVLLSPEVLRLLHQWKNLQ